MARLVLDITRQVTSVRALCHKKLVISFSAVVTYSQNVRARNSHQSVVDVRFSLQSCQIIGREKLHPFQKDRLTGIVASDVCLSHSSRQLLNEFVVAKDFIATPRP